MKKLVVSAVVLMIAAAFIVSCGPRGLGGQVKGQTFVTEGWVNDDTFRVTSTGAPKPGLTNKIQRRGTAKEAAIIMAQKTMIEKFKGARLEGAAGAADYASTGIAVMKEFSGTVKGGSVIRETYDDDDNCEVVYELISRGLKKKVIGGVD
jgi:hypothetical protein